MKKGETTLIFGDVHGVYYDPRAWRILLNVIKKTKPDRVIINGDFIDCYSISHFDKDPSRDFNLQDEFEQANSLLDELQHVFKGELVYVFGNHESRLKRLLWGNNPELDCIPEMSIEGKLHLEERGIEFVRPRGKDAYYQLGAIKVGHFDIARKDSCASAKALVLKYACSVVQAHVHRLGMIFKNFDGNIVVGIETGCMCKLNPEYTSDPDWQTGFAIVTGKVNQHIQLFHIKDYEVLVDGVVYD